MVVTVVVLIVVLRGSVAVRMSMRVKDGQIASQTRTRLIRAPLIAQQRFTSNRRRWFRYMRKQDVFKAREDGDGCVW